MFSLQIMVKVFAGTDIHEAIKDAIQLSKELGDEYISFSFNGVLIIVNSRSKIEERVQFYHKLLRKSEIAEEQHA
ncbi:hypothetical protein LCGC14_2769810 [marine sediment metagenome]|uniref:Uncharacterized protein n=1 Tax=marine sediment metagenome TaxID=412755 RepID=A0A0F8YWI8_9ZZZZ